MRNKALSPYISAAFVILLGIVAVSLTITVLTPAFNKAKDSAVMNEALHNLELIDEAVKEIASEGEGSKRTIYLKVTEGTYRVDSENDFINFTYRMKEGLEVYGQRGRVNITRSGGELKLFIEYTNLDIQGDDRFTKGVNSVVVLHNGTNPTTNYPIVYVGR
jgi:hypothetical protein